MLPVKMHFSSPG